MLPLADTAKQKRTPLVTLLLVAANLGVFGWQVWLFLQGGERAAEGFTVQHALMPQRFVTHWQQGAQWQTLLTHMFLHGGLAHVLGNVWFLWIFGGNVEDRLGGFRYFLFYIVAGVTAALAQFAVDPGASVPMVGASGAISGVLGAYFVLFPTAWVWALVPWVVPILPVPAVLFLVLWFLLQALNGFGSLIGVVTLGPEGAHVAWVAHAGGFLAGVVLIMTARRRGWVRRK